jgi:threonine/homoserine/homoserine lactone efflux protein
MTYDQILAFCAFAAISSITPGPNNTMIMASGLNHGFVRSLPHLAGISLGFMFLVLASGLGLHAVFVQVPALQTVLKYVGAAYLLWLAWKLATAVPMSAEEKSSSRPMTFLAAAAFQWVNPKAWVMAVSGMTTYLPNSSSMVDVLLMAVLFAAVGLPCVMTWALGGVALRRVLQDPRSVRIFNGVAAALLVASLYPMLKG